MLPGKGAHNSCHPTCGEAGFAQRVHHKVAEKIHELVTEGVTNVREIKRDLKRYVNRELCSDVSSRPDETNRAYYPTLVDIRNHVFSAQKALELSKFDQNNLKLKVEEWEKEKPSSKFFFRPFEEDGANSEKLVQHEEAPAQNLLYIHQEKWQRNLLQRYGNTMVLMDATYKTTKYELPLFLVTVKTNVGYSIVADFVVQSESAQEICEALKVLSDWNPQWKPAFFMTDYCEAEISAIESVFPECKVYLCDFHREQSWERWIKDGKHGLAKEDQPVLLGLLRCCAFAEPSAEPDFEKNYKREVDNLKRTKIWKENEQLRNWLETKWFSIPQVCFYFIRKHCMLKL